MSDDRPKSDVFAQRRRDRGLSRPRESHRLGTIGQQENSWPVTEASKDALFGVFLQPREGLTGSSDDGTHESRS
jgi:hypothetical protein